MSSHNGAGNVAPELIDPRPPVRIGNEQFLVPPAYTGKLDADQDTCNNIFACKMLSRKLYEIFSPENRAKAVVSSLRLWSTCTCVPICFSCHMKNPVGQLTTEVA